MSDKSYIVTIEVEVSVKDNGMVAQKTDSVEAAVRHLMRTLFPRGWRKNGTMFYPGTVHVTAMEKPSGVR